MKPLSIISEKLTGQPMFKVLAKAQKLEREGKRILHFEIGDTSFHSPHCAIESAKKALDNGQTNYTNSMGMVDFRQSIADHTLKNWGFKPTINQILVSPANAIIDFIIRCTSNPGDEIIFPDPGFPTYLSSITYNGMVPVNIQLREENDFRMLAVDVEKKITDRTKLIILNSPSNPTGTVMSEKEITKIADLACANDLYILSDEIYSKVMFDKDHYSVCSVEKYRERTILLNSFSKSHAMSGWRLGYAVGPELLISKMGLLFETIFSCTPPFIQIAGQAVLTDKGQYLPHRVAVLKERRDIIFDRLNSINGISCPMPDGAFYAFPTIKETGLSSSEYCDRLLHKYGVCLLPGDCFGEFGKSCIRICFGSTPIDQVEEALNLIEKFHTEDLGL